MAWVQPSFDKERVNAAAKRLVVLDTLSVIDWDLEEATEYAKCIEVINNWRSAHSYPLNTFQMNMRKRAAKFESGAIIAQRIKRLPSITSKLNRFPKMKLSQMQDIGGCRAILLQASSVHEMMTYYTSESSIKHERVSVDDYVTCPKSSGYRGVHIVYRYLSDKDGGNAYNGLKIEMQIRTQLQHAWATAVETVGTFQRQALKSSIGSEDWLRFFALMASYIASREKQALVPGTPTEHKELIEELRRYAHKLDVARRLEAFGSALNNIGTTRKISKKKEYFLLSLDKAANSLTIKPYDFSQLAEANRAYSAEESASRNNLDRDAVLVSVDSISALEKAYPNYFADTRVFVSLLKQALADVPKRIRPPPPLPFSKSSDNQS